MSDKGVLSHLMTHVCKLVGIEKLSTTSYQPQCNGMVERFNRTLKSVLRKRDALFGKQRDNHLFGLLWAYHNAQHDTTGQKLSFLLFGWDCKSTEANLLPVTYTIPTSLEDYGEQRILTLSSAREKPLGLASQKAQNRYEANYDCQSDDYTYRVGD